MKITDIKIFPVALEGRLKAYVSITFDDSFIVREIKLIQNAMGMFVSMPSRRKADGSFKDIAHPLNNEMRKRIEEKVIEAYELAKQNGFPDALNKKNEEDEQISTSPVEESEK
jgi:stage V sporulation protein G